MRSRALRTLALGIALAAALAWPLKITVQARTCCVQCQYVQLCCDGASAYPGCQSPGDGCIAGFGCRTYCNDEGERHEDHYNCSDYGG